MTRNVFGFAALTALLLGMMPAVALAEELSDPFEAMYNPKKLLRGAALTEAQVAQIRELRRSTRAQEREVEQQIQTLNAKFADMFTSEASLDASVLLALCEQVDQLDLQLDRLKLPNMVKIRALLTPEQLHRVAEAHQIIKNVDVQRKSLDAQKKALDPTIAGEEGP